MQSLSRTLQRLSFVRARLLLALFHRWRLVACGSKCIVLRPLFWTPEHVSLGRDVLIWPGCRIEGLQDVAGSDGPHIDIGDRVSMQQHCHVTAAGHLRIGAGTTILCNVVITDVDHRYSDPHVPVTHQAMDVRRTEIGDHCFIGAGARILPGTTLGHHSVVGANSVVRGDFPPGSVIAGVPGRVVKQATASSLAPAVESLAVP